jgi:dTDP-glucose 4,6-dehydratase
MFVDQRFLITEGLGFIGSHLVEYLLQQGAYVNAVDALFAPARRDFAIKMGEIHGKYFRFTEGDVTDLGLVKSILSEPYEGLFHLAAQTHVDTALAINAQTPSETLRNTLLTTESLLEGLRWVKARNAHENKESAPRFIYVSTDEVYGAYDEKDPYNQENYPQGFKEYAPTSPKNPYSVYKTASESLALSYAHSFGLEVLITRGENTFGARQYPEKLLPKSIRCLLNPKKYGPIPVYGDGLQKRCWLSAEDHAQGIALCYQKGRAGQIYNLGTGDEITNLTLLQELIKAVGTDEREALQFVEDRPGHDRAYKIDSSKARNELGFAPRLRLLAEINHLIDAYR